MRKILCLCILMVGGLNSWETATEKRNELMSKKHEFVIMTNSFPFNDFQEIYAIIAEGNEIVGKPATKENGCNQKKHLSDGTKPIKFSFKKPPEP